jgi:hypothetical protein
MAPMLVAWPSNSRSGRRPPVVGEDPLAATHQQRVQHHLRLIDRPWAIRV